MEKTDEKIIYEPHPVTPERKAELRAKGFKIIKSDVRMPTGPLKTIGEFPLEVGLHTDVVVGITVTIVGAQ